MKEAREQAEEEVENEKRKNNIIVYRMPESTADSVETRRKEDHDFVINLLVNAVETECEPNDVSKIARLGKREGTHRPVLVEFKSRTTKNMVMESMS